MASIPASRARTASAARSAPSGGIGVRRDIEAAQEGRERDGGEMACGQSCDHRQGGQRATQREDGFDPLARRHDLSDNSEANRMGPDVAERALRVLDRRLAMIRRHEIRVEPGTVNAGHPAVEVGDDADQRGPSLGLGAPVRSIKASGVESEGVRTVEVGDAPSPQIGLRQRSGNRPAKADQPLRRRQLPWWRIARFDDGFGRGPRQVEETSSLVGDVVEPIEAACFADDIEEVAMFAGRGVSLMCS